MIAERKPPDAEKIRLPPILDNMTRRPIPLSYATARARLARIAASGTRNRRFTGRMLMESQKHRAEFDAAVEAFLAWQRYRGRRVATIEGYQKDLKKLRAWLASEFKPFPPVAALGDIDRSSMNRFGPWIAAQSRLGLGACAIRRNFVSVRMFYRYLVEVAETFTRDASRALISPARPRRLPKTLSSDQVMRLLALPDSSNPVGARDAAILALFAYCGPRPIEVIRANDSDYVRGEHPCLRVLGKGRERLLPLPAPVAEALERWIAVRWTRKPEAGEALFVSQWGTRLNSLRIKRIFDPIRAVLGLPWFTPYSLRRTFATSLWESGCALGDVAVLMGHASTADTQIYTRTSAKVLAERARPMWARIEPRKGH